MHRRGRDGPALATGIGPHAYGGVGAVTGCAGVRPGRTDLARLVRSVPRGDPIPELDPCQDGRAFHETTAEPDA